jgi:hypothetical protein
MLDSPHPTQGKSLFFTRIRVMAQQRLGIDLDNKKTQIVVIGFVGILFLVCISLWMSSDDYSLLVDGSNSGSSGDGSSSLHLDGNSNARLDDDSGGGDEDGIGGEDGESTAGGGGGGDGEENVHGEDEEGGGGAGESSNSNDEAKRRAAEKAELAAEKYKAKQLRLFQDKDKSFLKFFTKHRKDSEVLAHFQELADTYKDLGIIKTTIIGTTAEKKNIVAYTIGRGKSNRAIMVTAVEKPNEWLGSLSLAYFATRLVQKYALTPTVTQVVENLYIHIIPVVNPDGLTYAVSSTSKMDWEFNRATKAGVDVSIDFESFSQLESQAVRNFAKKVSKTTFAFISVRCCNGRVRLPNFALCKNTGKQKQLGESLANSMGKGGSLKYSFSVDESASKARSTGFAFKELGIGLTYELDAKISAKSLSSVKSTELLHASQNITMGVMELAKFVMINPMPGGLGGGGNKPCSSSSTSSSGRKNDGDDENGESNSEDGGGGGEDENNGDGDEHNMEDDGENRGGDDESSGGTKDLDDDESSSSSTSSMEDDNVDHAASLESAKDGSKYALSSNLQELRTSLHYAQQIGIHKPFLPRNEIPTQPLGKEDYFLYWAYGPDMVHEVLLRAGIMSAWKVVNAKLLGYMLDYTYHSNLKWKSGVADIVKSTHSSVYGVVWKIHISELPILEAWQMSTTPTSPQAKKIVTVTDDEGTEYTALTFYVVRKSKGDDILLKYHRFPPSRQYRNCILKGAKQHHLPYDYVEHRLRSRSLAPLFTDKIGSTGHRNPTIGAVCDPY